MTSSQRQEENGGAVEKYHSRQCNADEVRLALKRVLAWLRMQIA
jgi:hypothetical protein